MKKFDNFYDAWWWLNETEIFHDPRFPIEKFGLSNLFQESLCIEVQKVNPKTNAIDDDETKNTKVEVWLECGEPFLYKDEFPTGYIPKGQENDIGYFHNWKYDCGGNTFEEAIIEMANLVYTHNEGE